MLDRVGSSIRNALLMCAGGMLIGGVCVALSFGIAARLWQFIPLFALGEFAWFATQARSFETRPTKGLLDRNSPALSSTYHLHWRAQARIRFC